MYYKKAIFYFFIDRKKIKYKIEKLIRKYYYKKGFRKIGTPKVYMITYKSYFKKYI